jgi:hypothetical protein
MNKTIESLVVNLSSDPFNPELNFLCATEYQKLKQTASAVSFYLRTAEYGLDTHKDIAYASLLKIAECFDDQKDRQFNVTNYLLHAISYMPQRPEAWYLLSVFHERSGNWQESYSFANVGLMYADVNNTVLAGNVNYPGKYALLFQKYVAAWWIGRKDESIAGLTNLLDKYDMQENFINACIGNLERIK